jgi:hypothetical protein
MSPTSSVLVDAWRRELEQAQRARASSRTGEEWRHLERAHILSQPLAGRHVRTHLTMLGAAFRRRDAREIAGQLMRLPLAAPGSWMKRYPVGNTGGSNVSAFTPMRVPDDLRSVLDAPR